MAKRNGTSTSTFGVGRREAHDSSLFYSGNLYRSDLLPRPDPDLQPAPRQTDFSWADQVYCHTSEEMKHIPDQSVGLGFTSPPYGFAQKDYAGSGYQDNQTLEDYLGLLERVGMEMYRVLVPGGRFVVNIANQGRRPYVPLVSFINMSYMKIGYLPMGEIIWQKGKGANGNCAWGSWQNARSPRLRDLHEYLLVFAKQGFSRPDKGISDISREEFMAATLSIWEIPPESAKGMGHPAPFPVALAERVIRLFSYKEDVILDPFAGSGTTCVAAALNDRHYVGYEISSEYCQIAEKRVGDARKMIQGN